MSSLLNDEKQKIYWMDGQTDGLVIFLRPNKLIKYISVNLSYIPLLDKKQLKKPPAKRRIVSIASDHTPFLRL